MNKIQRLIEKLKSHKEKESNLLFNIILGILTMMCFVLLRDTTFNQVAINKWFDYFIYFRIGSDTQARQAGEKIVYLSFDNKSMLDLDRSPMIPRNKLADLVDIAYKGHAEIIILDFDFTERDYSPEKQIAGDLTPINGVTRDGRLTEILSEIKRDTNSSTKVIINGMMYADKTLKDNFLLPLVDNKKIFLATPNFTVSHYTDYKARFWMPYTVTKDNNILWSIPLLSSALYYGGEEQLIKIAGLIQAGTAEEYHVVSNDGKHKINFFSEKLFNDEVYRNTGDNQYNRIEYTMVPPNVLLNDPIGNIKPGNIAHWRKNGIDNKRFNCEEKIVVIGREDDDCSDIHATTVGEMPGMYIHGNSIATVLGGENPHIVSVYTHIILELLLIIITALAYYRLTEFKAKLVTILLVALCWCGSYVFFCFTNTFVYFSFSFTSIGIYEIITNLERAVNKGVAIKEYFNSHLIKYIIKK